MDKAVLRKSLLKLHSSLDQGWVKGNSDAINIHALNIINTKNPKIVGLYHSINSEVDVSYLANVLLDLGIEIAYPSKDLCFKKATVLVETIFFENGEVCIPELIIVPTLGFNKDMYRLGLGQGFYDKYFAKNKVMKVGLSFNCFETDFVPSLHDVPMDIIITETYGKN